MSFLDDIGSWTNILNTGINAVSAYNSYSAASDASSLANKTFDTIAGSTAKQDEIAQELFDRYKTTYWPLEDQEISLQESWMKNYTPEIQQQAWNNYSSELSMQPQYIKAEQSLLDQANISAPEWGQRYAQQAHADTQQSYDAQRAETQRNLTRMGVDPTSGRSLTALNSGMDVAQSLTDVQGQNSALQQGYDTQWNRLSGALAYKSGNSIPQQTSVSNNSGLASSALSGLGSSNSANSSLLSSALKSASAGSSAYGSSLSALLGSGSGSLSSSASALSSLYGYS